MGGVIPMSNCETGKDLQRPGACSRLAQRLVRYKGTNGVVLAVPAGGVPVAAEIARELGLPLDLVIVRKIQVPFNTETGFGAMDPGGEVIFHQELLKQLGLTDEDVQLQLRKTKEVIVWRNRLFRVIDFSDGAAGTIVVDDGLASGYTMSAGPLCTDKNAREGHCGRSYRF
jgi:predicted phosphoribosyltransferase